MRHHVSTPWQREAGMAALLFVLVCLPHAGLLTGRRTYFEGDLLMLSLPFRQYVATRLGHGEIPWWTPQVACGFPLFAQSEAGILYPPNTVNWLLPAAVGMNWVILLHLWWGGLGVYLVCRSLSACPWAALLGGVCFADGGFMVSQIEHVNLLSAAAWLPWGVWILEAGRRRSMAFSVGWLSAVFGTQLLAGHGYIVLISWLTTGAYAVFRGLSDLWAERDAIALRLPLAWLLAVIGGAMLGCAQALPSMEMTGHTWRAGGLTYSQSIVKSYTPLHLAAWLFPGILGRGAGYWGLGQAAYNDLVLYLGVAGWAMALMACLTLPVRQWWVWGALFLVGLAASLGPFTPVWKLLHSLPVMKMMRVPARFLLAPSFAAAVLAALGAHHWARLPDRADGAMVAERAARLWTVLAGVVVAALPVVHFIGRLMRPALIGAAQQFVRHWVAPHSASVQVLADYDAKIDWCYHQFLRTTAPWSASYLLPLAFILAVTWLLRQHAQRSLTRDRAIGLALALAGLDLGVFGVTYRGTAPAEKVVQAPPLVQSVQDDSGLFRCASVDTPLASNNQALLFDIPHVNGLWCAMSLRRHTEVMAALGDVYLPDAPPPETPYHAGYNLNLANALNVKYLFTREPMTSPVLHEVKSDDQGYLYANEMVRPRATLVGAVRVVPDAVAVARQMGSDDYDPTEVVFVEHPGPLAPGIPSRPDDREQCLVTSYQDQRVTIRATTTGRRLLVLWDAAYPGWRARVDGRWTSIVVANCLFRGVYVEAGDHDVEFIFLPQSIRLGLFVSLVTLLALAALVTTATMRRLGMNRS